MHIILQQHIELFMTDQKDWQICSLFKVLDMIILSLLKEYYTVNVLYTCDVTNKLGQVLFVGYSCDQ